MSKNISKIIYINLNKRPDRRTEIEYELDSFGLSYERFEAIETPGIGILGCGYSHLCVLKMAKEKGYENVLILEDDFMFVVSKENFEKQLTDFFNLNIDYDVCMLSYNLIRHDPTQINDNFLYKLLEAQTASGYLVNKKYYDTLINLYEHAMPLLSTTREHWNYANDQVWKKNQEKDNWFCFINRIGVQRPSYSDNIEKYMDHGV